MERRNATSAHQEASQLDRPALYYPYIHIRSEHWLKATLLCVPAVKRIVPEDYRPEDQPNIAKYTKIRGVNGALLQAIPAFSSAAFHAQERLLDKLREHADAIHNKYSRQHAPAVDNSWIHVAKFNEDLLRYLRERGLAWPSEHSRAYGHRTWYALHPKLASAIMTTLGLSIAKNEKYDIVTDSGPFHEALLANREDAIFDALLAGAESGPTRSPQHVQQELRQLVITLAVNFEALQAEDIPEIQASKNFHKFQRLIRTSAQRVDRDTDPERYNAQLKQEAGEILETWHQAQNEMGKRLRGIASQGIGLVAAVAKFAHAPDFSEIVATGSLVIGLVHSGRALIDNLRASGPCHYLTEIKRAENEFLRMTFPLGLER